MADILEIVKKAALDAVNNSSPSSILFGVVSSVNPLEIQVEQKLTLTKEFLVLTKNVVDFNVNVTLNLTTENKDLSVNHSHLINGDIEVNSTITPNQNNQTITNQIISSLNTQEANINLTHNHSIIGTKTITIHNALKENDKVILLQQQGGQKFIVLDKIY